jgi:hypothetical protein
MSERPPIEAVITFAPHAPICILRVDDQEIAPAAWPVREKKVTPPASRARFGWVFPVVGLALLAAAGFVVRSLRSDAKPTGVASKLAGTYRAQNGLFVAHYPPDLEPRAAVLPPSIQGVVLDDKAKTASVLIAALPHAEGLHDGWALQQRWHGEAMANMPTGDGSYTEVGRREGRCCGRPGAIVTGRVVRFNQPTARIWTCAFTNEHAGYFAMTMLMEPVTEDVERGARIVIEGTELTRLTDLTANPQGTIALPSALPVPESPPLLPSSFPTALP